MTRREIRLAGKAIADQVREYARTTSDNRFNEDPAFRAQVADWVNASTGQTPNDEDLGRIIDAAMLMI